MRSEAADTALATPYHQTVSRDWRLAAVRLTAAWLVLLVAFAGDWLAMARQWWDISTYNHILLVPFILAWLVWQRWTGLKLLTPRAWYPGMLLLFGAAFVWLLGAISGLDLARQAGVVAMTGACVPLLLGVRVTAGVAFPLLYLVFLIPIGEELVPALQMVTADITIGLTHLSGIPAKIDGVFIDTPAGLFEVAEACSGGKFLIAMIAFGALMANVCFVSNARRAVLLLSCVVVPILANGVRAWGTIYAAQFFGVEAAAGFDHIVYGWIFFALVLTLVIALAWRFFDRPVSAPSINPAAIGLSVHLARLESLGGSTAISLAGFAVILGGVHAWATTAVSLSAPLPTQIQLPAVKGWSRVDYDPSIWWEPRAQGSDHRLLGRYRNADGQVVDVFFALYASQEEGKEAGGFGQGALVPASEWSWQSPISAPDGGKGERLLGNGKVVRVAMTWYRLGDQLSGSNARLKLAVIADRLLFRRRPTMMLILSAEDSASMPAARSIARFLSSTGPLGAWMDRIEQGR